MLRFSRVANVVCLWRRRVPSLRSSQDGVACCFASLALQTACAGGAVGPFASLVTRRRRSLLRFSCVADDMCLRRRRSLRFARHATTSPVASLLLRRKRREPAAPSALRFARHMTALLVTSLLLRRKRRVPVAPPVPSPRSSHDGVTHCFASLALQTVCACGAVGPFASLVARRRRSLLRYS